jgi:hypothetical protein
MLFHKADVGRRGLDTLPPEERDRTIPQELRNSAVGRVTAGIIHDANNALAVVVWNLERATRTLTAGDKEASSAKTALKSTMKAAALLQRVLEYAGHGTYDPSLANLEEMLSRLFATASAVIETDIGIDCQIGNGVGPVIVDETLLELALLDLVATLSRNMAKEGSITLTAANFAPERTPPEAPNTKILLSLNCIGLMADRMPPLQDTLLQHFAEQAGGKLVAIARQDRCEIRLYLPRAVSSSGDGTVFF